MSDRPPFDVCMAVVSHLPFDARVWKEARSLAAAGHRVALLGLAYDLTTARRRNERGVEVLELPLGERGRGSRTTRALGVLRLFLATLSTPARVYHAHNVHTGPPAWLAARLRRAALVYDGHELFGDAVDGSLAARARARIELALERFLVRRSEAVVTTNASRAETLQARHGRRPVHVLANVPPLVTDLEPLDPGFPTAGPVLLYQGGVYPESRAFRETIDAIALLDDVQLVVLGFGRPDMLARLRQWAADAGVSERVHFLPPRPFDELVRTAAAATVGLVPIKPDSLGAYLGDTNKLHEYLMAGLPVVASDLPEIRRVAREGEPPVGEVFDPSSPESIADAVRRVLADPEEYERRRGEARRLALERYNWETEERTLLDVYRRLGPPHRRLVPGAAES